MIWWILSVGVFGSIGAGAAVGAALGIVGMIILQVYVGGATDLAVLAVQNTLGNFTLSALPMFIIMGEILVASGLSQRIYTALAPLFSRVPGRLLHTNIAVCTAFGSVSGSSVATAAAVCAVSYPELSKRGYDKSAILGSIAGASTLGLLIPPSLSLLLYGAWQEVSIGQLFLAGIVPGLVLSLLFMIYVVVASHRKAIVPLTEVARESDGNPLRHLVKLWPLVILAIGVLGTIYLGVATPTEAAGLGVILSILLGVSIGDLTVSKLAQALHRATVSISAIAFVLIGAVILGQSISILGLPRQVIELATGLGLGPYQMITFVALFYLILGCFFDGITLMLLSLPFLFPLVVSLGFDPVWFGVFVTIMIEIGLITPPIGMNLYVIAALTKREVSVEAIALAALPYWLILLFGAGLLVAFPSIALFLPRLVY
ncbi:TRAP transporter large permease [Oceanibacterium hippocampi]|uniref:TRAP transporter large permease protein n=1 Tax=Oceanibacterium hippocampi TaxID=745714 RepID=A0A1Y5TWL7_9PROT|nr:TRAP transporter large permease [Oceanibacterium hippocampi]SLN75534.1 Sialic acid TRAP transporter permease protein SiaT [Oceanibacterium hippocampi]